MPPSSTAQWYIWTNPTSRDVDYKYYTVLDGFFQMLFHQSLGSIIYAARDAGGCLHLDTDVEGKAG